MLAHGDDDAELAALEQYHALLETSKSNVEQCARLITDGFVPSGRKALVEAGLRCVHQVNIDLPFATCNEQWVRRLETISTRLRVMAGDEALRAVGEFDAKAKAWRAADARETRVAFSFFILLGFAIVVVVWWLIRRIWPG